jgi:hypothetical protein
MLNHELLMKMVIKKKLKLILRLIYDYDTLR